MPNLEIAVRLDKAYRTGGAEAWIAVAVLLESGIPAEVVAKMARDSVTLLNNK